MDGLHYLPKRLGTSPSSNKIALWDFSFSFRGRTASNKIHWKIKDMGFGDLKNRSGLEALNTYLEHNSYIEGYVSCFWSLLNAYKEGNMFRPRALDVISSREF